MLSFTSSIFIFVSLCKQQKSINVNKNVLFITTNLTNDQLSGKTKLLFLLCRWLIHHWLDQIAFNFFFFFTYLINEPIADYLQQQNDCQDYLRLNNYRLWISQFKSIYTSTKFYGKGSQYAALSFILDLYLQQCITRIMSLLLKLLQLPTSGRIQSIRPSLLKIYKKKHKNNTPTFFVFEI